MHVSNQTQKIKLMFTQVNIYFRAIFCYIFASSFFIFPDMLIMLLQTLIFMKTQNTKNKSESIFSDLEINIADLHLQQISPLSTSPININTYPYNCIGLLKYTNPHSGNTLNATAFLIDSDLIVTCAHNIYNKEEGFFYTNFEFQPSDTRKNIAPVKIRQFRVAQQFKNKSNEQADHFDYGMLKLKRQVIRSNYFKIKYNYKQQNQSVSLYGYPKPLKEKRLFGTSGAITKIDEGLIVHNLNTEIGQSGSPIFITRQNHSYLIGIHKGILNNANVGVLISKEVMFTFCKWQKQMAMTHLVFSEFNEQLSQQCQNISMYFSQFHCELNTKESNLQKLEVQWQTIPENNNKFTISNDRLIRKSGSLFDDKHKQITSKQPLPKIGKHMIRFKIIKYGVGKSFDSLYFGIITKSRKNKDNSDGRQKQAIAYCCSPNNFGLQGGFGTLLMDGKQIAHGKQNFVQEGGEIKLILDFEENEVCWSNGKQENQFKMNKSYQNKQLYLFVSMCSESAIVSWKSLQNQVWI